MRLFKYALATFLLIPSAGIAYAIIGHPGRGGWQVSGIAFIVTMLCVVTLLYRSGHRGDTGSAFERLLILIGVTAASRGPLVDRDRSDRVEAGKASHPDRLIYVILYLSIALWMFPISPWLTAAVVVSMLAVWIYRQAKPGPIFECAHCNRAIPDGTELCSICQAKLPRTGLR